MPTGAKTTTVIQSPSTSTPRSPAPPTASSSPLRRVPGTSLQIDVRQGSVLLFVAINVGVPPFDSIHVRRAASYAIDRSAILALMSDEGYRGQPATHLFPDALEDGFLRDFDPYASPNRRAAHAEMRMSRYDSDGDGVCDARVCEEVPAVFAPGGDGRAFVPLARGLRRIGITLDVISFDRYAAGLCLDPARRQGLCIAFAWGSDYPEAYTFAHGLLDARSIGPNACCNASMLGAPRAKLQRYDYAVEHVPNVQRWLNRCEAQITERERCWAELDRHLMTDVVPIIPISFDDDVNTLSRNVSNYFHDSFSGIPALDRLVVART